MTEEEKRQIILNAKYARIIICISEMGNISYNEATDIFYNSETAEMIEEGIADLHCRSDKYLASLIWEEYQEKEKSLQL